MIPAFATSQTDWNLQRDDVIGMERLLMTDYHRMIGQQTNADCRWEH